MSVLDQLDLFRFNRRASRAKAVTSRTVDDGDPPQWRTHSPSLGRPVLNVPDLPHRQSAKNQSAKNQSAKNQSARKSLVGVRVDTAFAYAERYQLSQECRALWMPTGEQPAPQTSWVERVPGWLTPDAVVFDALMADTAWQKQRREMYDRVVDVPRLLGRPTPGARSTTLLLALSQLLSLRYGRRLNALSMALYRDGQDSVAPHGDKLGTLIPDTVVAILSLGHPRTMRLRPKAITSSNTNKPSLRFDLGNGDLFVMGGRCQADWLHGVAKVRHAKPRISIMFREEHAKSA